MLYKFILNMWVMRKIDEEKVRSYVPRWITAEEAEIIILQPRISE